MDYSKITLGELLSSENETIKRNAVGILKKLQRGKKCGCGRIIEITQDYCEECQKENKEANRIERKKQKIWGQGKF